MAQHDLTPANRAEIILIIRMAIAGTLDGGHRRRKAKSPADLQADQRLAENILKALEERNFQFFCGKGVAWHSTS